MSNIYYWEKLTFSKLRFSLKENSKKCTISEEQKGTRYIRGNVYFVHYEKGECVQAFATSRLSAT